MGEVSTIGLDLAKEVFQVHGADAAGAVVFRKRLRRTAFLQFFAAQAPCGVAMEACAVFSHATWPLVNHGAPTCRLRSPGGLARS